MNDPNITMKEYIRLEEEKARRRDIVFNDTLMSEHTENDNDKVNMPSFPSPEPTVSYSDELDFFKDFENEFPAIVYNDAQTSKSDLLDEPTYCTQHIDEFDSKEETSLSECDAKEQNVLYFNDLFPFNVIYRDDLKSDTDNDNDKIDIELPSGDMSVIPNIVDTTYPNPMDTSYSLSGRYPVFIFSTVYTAYSLVYRYQYDVSEEMDTAYQLPVQFLGPSEGRSTNIGGEFKNLEILKCWSLEASRQLFNTRILAHKLKIEKPPSKYQGCFSF
uniref:Uncharacterized protein n=1 Tax=Tanacetum cinerariifolium TaxID=118510 RepID=A0A699IDH7_TANCI|nr:hypothetical protein [Tanacetum cinerariifolium]